VMAASPPGGVPEVGQAESALRMEAPPRVCSGTAGASDEEAPSPPAVPFTRLSGAGPEEMECWPARGGAQQQPHPEAQARSRVEMAGMLRKWIANEFARQSSAVSEAAGPAPSGAPSEALRPESAAKSSPPTHQPAATAAENTESNNGPSRARPDPNAPATTLMVRNIPADCTCEILLREWPIDGTYDLLYLPRRSGGKVALGYVFINFVSPAHAAAFHDKWRLKRLAHYPNGRSLNIVVAQRQGFEANLRQLRSKSAEELEARGCEVVILAEGRRVRLQDLH